MADTNDLKSSSRLGLGQRQRRMSGAPQAELLQDILRKAGITTWDFAIIGDGSGCGWKAGCGWAGIVIDHETRGRQMVNGAMNVGSINMAELMPYLQILTWLHQEVGKSRLKRTGILNVHIITDSQVVAKQGVITANPALDLPKVQQGLWAAMREFGRLGYHLHWHWADRMTNELNSVADLIAGLSRRTLIAAGITDDAAEAAAQRAADALDHVSFKDPLSGSEISLHDIAPFGEETHGSTAQSQ